MSGSDPMPAPGPGTIVSYSVEDNVGRIRLDSGETLKFGLSGVLGFAPADGLRVKVGMVEPHPLGGYRGRKIELLADQSRRKTPVPDRDRAAEAEAEAEALRWAAAEGTRSDPSKR